MAPDEEVQRKPWRYVGYPEFAKWTASDHDFFVLRRFDSLAVRTLLWRQWQLTKVESQLKLIDFDRGHGASEDLHNGSFEQDDEERQDCIRSAYGQLKEYCMCNGMLWAYSNR